MPIGLAVVVVASLLFACRATAPVSADVGDRQNASPISIAVTDRGFEPDRISVKRGTPVTLIFERQTKRACLKEVVIYTSEHETVRRELPVGVPVAVTVTFDRSGELGYACGMGMYGGSIVVH